MQAMYYVGGTIAAFSIGFLAERYGRKWAIAAVSEELVPGHGSTLTCTVCHCHADLWRPSSRLRQRRHVHRLPLLQRGRGQPAVGYDTNLDGRGGTCEEQRPSR